MREALAGLMLVVALSPAVAFEKERAEAERCFQTKAAQYATASCDAAAELSGAVRGACQDEYRAALAAFAADPRSASLSDADKLDLGKKLFTDANERIEYYIVEQRIVSKACQP